MSENPTWCAECGFGVCVDDDGCCLTCGANAMGHGVDEALALRAEVERLRELMSATELAHRGHILFSTAYMAALSKDRKR